MQKLMVAGAIWHLKVAAYIRCFIHMSLYNNFNQEIDVDVLWKKIEFMFENKNAVNRVSVFRKNHSDFDVS